jgi:hypothetical protein
MRYVEFEVDGKVKKLRFDFNAIADLEQQAGAGVGSLFSEERVGYHTIRLLFWAGLRWEDQGLTMQRTGMILKQLLEEGHSLEDLSTMITKALQVSGLFGKSFEEDGGEIKAPFVPKKQHQPKKSQNSKQ